MSKRATQLAARCFLFLHSLSKAHTGGGRLREERYPAFYRENKPQEAGCFVRRYSCVCLVPLLELHLTSRTHLMLSFLQAGTTATVAAKNMRASFPSVLSTSAAMLSTARCADGRPLRAEAAVAASALLLLLLSLQLPLLVTKAPAAVP